MSDSKMTMSLDDIIKKNKVSGKGKNAKKGFTRNFQRTSTRGGNLKTRGGNRNTFTKRGGNISQSTRGNTRGRNLTRGSRRRFLNDRNETTFRKRSQVKKFSRKF